MLLKYRYLLAVAIHVFTCIANTIIIKSTITSDILSLSRCTGESASPGFNSNCGEVAEHPCVYLITTFLIHTYYKRLLKSRWCLWSHQGLPMLQNLELPSLIHFLSTIYSSLLIAWKKTGTFCVFVALKLAMSQSILKCKCSIHKCIIDSKSIDRMVWAWYLQNNYEAAEVHLY
jgi:hypothetical protein